MKAGSSIQAAATASANLRKAAAMRTNVQEAATPVEIVSLSSAAAAAKKLAEKRQRR